MVQHSMDEGTFPFHMRRLLLHYRNFLFFLLGYPLFFVQWCTSKLFARSVRFSRGMYPGSLRYPKIFTDVIYCGTFKPDAEKDLVALRKVRPGLHITALLSGLNVHPGKFFVFRLCDRVVFWNTHDELLQYLHSIKARALVFQGGDDHAIAPVVCQWPGRFVWQVRESHLRIPRKYLESAMYEQAVDIAERADAMVSFHRKEAWDSLRNAVHFRSMPQSIPPLCVPELGPKKRMRKLSGDDGEIHIIYASGLSPVGGVTSHGIHFTNGDLYTKFRSIVAQGIHLHVYAPPMDCYSTKYKEYFGLAQHSSYLHIERTIPFTQLLTEFTRYDWAILHVTWQLNLFNPGFEYPIQNGLMGPIQSGIPIIVSPTAKGNAELVERYKRGLVVVEEDISRLREILSEQAWLKEYCRDTPLEHDLLYDVEVFGRAVLP